MAVVNDYRLKLGSCEFVPIVIGGMGVDISTAELALEACRLGGIGHISDAMVPWVCDRRFHTNFTKNKAEFNKNYPVGDKSAAKFILEDLYQAQFQYVEHTISRKKGSGAVFINVMEKLSMADPLETLKVRLRAALDGGIDGITLSAGLHTHSFRLIEDHPRFKEAKLGIIVSSVRALKIFLRSAKRSGRFPDYIIVEGPLAGGHLGFGLDWQEYNLREIVTEVIFYLKSQDLHIPVIPAGGVFTGSDAVEFLQLGAAAVQVATRFTVCNESGLPPETKQKYFLAEEEEVLVSCTSPTGYLIRLLANSPCLESAVKPNCSAYGYVLEKNGECQYIDAYNNTDFSNGLKKPIVKEKMCLCYHFGRYNCYTCGHYVYRLKDTTVKLPDGSYQPLSVEHVFKDYQFSKDHQIMLPEPKAEVNCNRSVA